MFDPYKFIVIDAIVAAITWANKFRFVHVRQLDFLNGSGDTSLLSTSLHYLGNCLFDTSLGIANFSHFRRITDHGSMQGIEDNVGQHRLLIACKQLFLQVTGTGKPGFQVFRPAEVFITRQTVPRLQHLLAFRQHTQGQHLQVWHYQAGNLAKYARCIKATDIKNVSVFNGLIGKMAKTHIGTIDDLCKIKCTLISISARLALPTTPTEIHTMSATPASPAMRRFNMAAFAIMIAGLPLWVWYCQISVHHFHGAITFPDLAFWSHISPPSWQALAFYGGWLLWQAGLYHFLPGKLEQGQPREDGSRLDYTLNGLTSFAITIALWAILHITGILPGSFIYDNMGAILTTANIVVYCLCFYVYFLGRSQANIEERKMHALEAFFLGAARNPRNGKFDWKFFCESRPGLTLWVVIALSCIAHQYQTFGTVSNSLLLTSFFICLYITDYYVVEDAVLTTWDIIHEPFGWMLCWGSLVYVPFFYPLAAVYLANHPYILPGWAVAAILCIGLAGYLIFRQCNIQKHRFRQNRNKKIWGKEPTFIQTQYGTRLLTSGWWGIASHANYLGDLLIALAMGLAAGSNTLFAYGYFLAFVILLIHRDWRDDRHCAAKYGDDWKEYRKKVRWHIIPGIY